MRVVLSFLNNQPILIFLPNMIQRIDFAALAPCIKAVSDGLVAIIGLPFDLIASIFKKKK